MDSFSFTVKTAASTPNANWGSVCHGVLIDTLPGEFGDILHDETVRPISQWVQAKSADTFIWHISSTDDGISELLWEKLQPGTELYAKHLSCAWTVMDAQRKNVPVPEYMKDIYLAETAPRGVSICFQTVTTHKSAGRYAAFPSVELIAGSLRNRICAVIPDLPFMDDDVMQQICDNTYINRYELRSAAYCLEGHYVPGYLGRLELHFKGPDPLRRLSRTLFEFANYTGIGIKTALGMGACNVEVLEERKNTK